MSERMNLVTEDFSITHKGLVKLLVFVDECLRKHQLLSLLLMRVEEKIM